MTWQVKIRIGVVVLLVVAVGAAAAWFVSADGGTDDSVPEVTDVANGTNGDVVEPMELAAQIDVVADDEVWVFGGLAGPDGSSPPMSSEIPKGWDYNRSIVMYGPAGDLRFHAELPGMEGHEPGSGVVIATGDERHLLITTCGRFDCDETAVLMLYRLVDDEAILVNDRVFAGFESNLEKRTFGRLILVGTPSDGTAWVTLETGGSRTMGFYDVELLGIDLETGQATPVDVPDGVTTVGHICVSGDEIFAIEERRDERGAMVALRVLRSPAIVDTDWTTFFEPEIALTDVWAATVECLPSGQVVGVFDELNGYGFQSIVADPASGVVGSPQRVSGIGALVTPIGELDGRTIFRGQADQGKRLMALAPDGKWTIIEDSVDWLAWPVVLAGQIRDISSARTAIEPDGLDFPLIDISG